MEIPEDPFEDIRRRREDMYRRRERRRSVISRVRNGLAKLIASDDEIKKSMSPMPSYVYEVEPVVRRPEWRYDVLIDVASRSWVMRQVIRAITQEVLGGSGSLGAPRWKVAEEFAVKCLDCQFKHEEEVDECEECGSTALRKPSTTERRVAEELIDRPNPDYNFDSLLRSIIFYKETVDDWFLHIAYKREFKVGKDGGVGEWERVPKEIYIEDSRFLYPVADEKGHLGNDEWFCTHCYSHAEDNKYVFTEGETLSGTVELSCPDCGAELQRTAYVIELGQKILQRFGRDEIVHGASTRVLPALFGNPPIISVYKILLTLENMDDYNWEIYRGGTLGGVLAFSGMEQSEVTQKKNEAVKELQRLNRADITSGRLTRSKKIRNLWIGIKEDQKVMYVPALDNPKNMQSLEYWKAYREVVGAVYGVTPVFVSVIESGKAGNNPRMQIDVQNRKTRDVQGQIEDVFNDQLFPIFGIYDWRFEFDVVEQKDELREAQIEQVKAAWARMYVEMGFDVERDEDGEITVTGKAINPYKMGEEGGMPGLGGPGGPEGMRSPSGAPRMPTAPSPRISEASGGWMGDLKSVLFKVATMDMLADDLIKAEEEGTLPQPVLPPGADMVAAGLEAELQEVLAEVKSEGLERSLAKAYDILDDYYQKLMVITRNYVSMKAGEMVPELDADMIGVLETLKAERKADIREILEDKVRV